MVFDNSNTVHHNDHNVDIPGGGFSADAGLSLINDDSPGDLSMEKFDPEVFLDTPIYAFDFQFMIGDVKDFLEMSELNIAWQYRRELQAIAQRTDFGDYPQGYREHLEDNANYRFRLSLPLRVRYGALAAFVTSVEWSVLLLNKQAREPVPERRRVNHAVEVLRKLSERAGLFAKSSIRDYKALVNVRNCVAHSAGLVDSYRHKDELCDSVNTLNGFSIANWQFMGDHITIERGALEPYVDAMRQLIIDLHRTLHERDLLRPSTEDA